MIKNSLGRDIPETVGVYQNLEPYSGIWNKGITKDNRKIVDSLEEAINKAGLQDGMTISFHHHFREGDILLNMVLDIIADLGIKNLVLFPSSLAATHSKIIKHIKSGVISRIYTSGLRSKLGEEISRGLMDEPVVIRSHGGRAGAIETGRQKIDVAFLAAPSADEFGNITGATGPSACGSMGYAIVDARNACKVIAVTDNIVEYPCEPISIPQGLVDYVVVVNKVGEPKNIARGALRKVFSPDPKNMVIANLVNEVICSTRYFREGFSLQTGSGSISLAAIKLLKEKMMEWELKGCFLLGGIIGDHVPLLKEGLFRVIFDTQSFDLEAVDSIKENTTHLEVAASDYANPFNKGPLVNNLSFVILSALEIDVNFNVNVISGSDGILRGASGGHSDTAAGSRVSIIVAPSMRGRIPTIKDRVTNIITPGESVDILVTERGICINPAREDLRDDLSRNKELNIIDIKELQREVEDLTGKPEPLKFSDRVVGLIEYRDGTIIDVVRQILN